MARTAPRNFSAIEDTGDLNLSQQHAKIWVPFMPLDPKRDAGGKAVVDANVLIYTCRPLGGRIEGPTILK